MQRGSVALFAVDKVVQRTARGVILEVLAEERDIALAGVAKRHIARDVRREQEIFCLSQRVIGGSGSGTTTSSAAPARWPESREAMSAS